MDVRQFVGEPEGQGFDLRIPGGREVPSRQRARSSIPSSRRAAGGTQSEARQRILSLAELMARANHIAASRYRIRESAVVLVTTPLLPDLTHCSCNLTRDRRRHHPLLRWLGSPIRSTRSPRARRSSAISSSAGNPGRFARTFLVELRGFEPLTSAVSASDGAAASKGQYCRRALSGLDVAR
jgi:hypothetical protein